MPWYSTRWSLTLEEPDVTKAGLRNLAAQRGEEIQRLQEKMGIILKDKGEMEDQNEDLEEDNLSMKDELEALRERDRLATEIIEAVDQMTVENCCDVARKLRNPITDWMQARMSLSQ